MARATPSLADPAAAYSLRFRVELEEGHGMEVAAAEAIASCASAEDLSRGVIVPSVFDPEMAVRVAGAVSDPAR